MKNDKINPIKAFITLLAIAAFANNASATTYLSDDFNDNVIDTNKWDTYITNLGGCSGANIQETNQELKVGVNYLRSYLHSKSPHDIGSDWEEIILSGKWKMTPTGTGVFTIIIKNGDINSGKYVSIQYNDWENRLNFYDSGSLMTYIPNRPIPSTYVPFKLIVRRTGWEYWENGVKVKSSTVTGFGDATTATALIGGWDGSCGAVEYVYFDDVVLETKDKTIPAPESGSAAALILAIIFAPAIAYKASKRN